MLSRVAAVKAPRTHSRRRVTGSSGRREVRESEPQRPNISRHLFCSAVLLLIVVTMCCGTGGAAEAPEQPSGPNYKWKDVNDEEGVTVESLGAPGLLNLGSDVFAVAEAQCKKDSVIFTGVASQLITKDNANAPVEVLKDPKETQVLEDGTSEDPKKVDVSRPTTILEGSDIYMLVGKYSPADVVVPPKNDAEDCGLLLVKGEVSDQSSKRIKWSYANAVPHASVGEQRQSWTGLIGGGGSGVKTDDGRLVFPVEGTKKGDAPNNVKTVSLLIYTLKDTAASWKLSKEAPDGGCSDPSIVEWGEKDKKLIMMAACDDGRRRVYESDDKGDEWTEALGTLSRVWSNKQDKEVKNVRSGFITATIDGDDNNRNVMLVTLPVYSEKADKKETGNSKGALHLWLTDNTHIVDIGPVSDDDAAASSLLYKSAGSETNKKEELIALYEKKKDDEGKQSPGMVSVPLTEQLQRVKEVLATWKEVDDRVSKLCPSSAEKDASPGNTCSTTVKITDGLVGFLSGNFFGNTWRDEYLGVNATVKNNDDGSNKATLHEGGVTFKGAWAEWPVGSQGENQLYHFANYNFTLVATVSIDKVPEGITHIPLMGVKMNDNENSVLMGLSYDSEKKRIVFCGGGQNKEHSSNWEPGKTHQLAIALQNEKQASAYVNGQRVGVGVPCALENTDSEAVSHFYIGGDGNSAGGAGRQEELSVTVRNVLLYNRPLSTAEIGALNANKASSSPVVPDNAQVTLSQSSSAGQSPLGPKSLNGNEGAGGGRTSTSEPSTVTTSLGKEQSVIQLPSGISSGGSKNVDAASSSDGDQRVGTEAGGAMQGNTPPQTPVDTPDTADTNAPTATDVAQVDPADTTEMRASSGANEETAEGRDGQEKDLHARDGEVKATALSSSLGNVSQGNNSDAGTVRGSGLLPSLLLLLGLWVFAAL